MEDVGRVEAEGANSFLRRSCSGRKLVMVSSGMCRKSGFTLEPMSGNEGNDVPMMKRKTFKKKIIFVPVGSNRYAVLIPMSDRQQNSKFKIPYQLVSSP